VNVVLTKMLEFEGHSVTGGWRRLHNEALHDRHCSLNVARVMKLSDCSTKLDHKYSR
jgi:hypothetical protein